MAFRDSIAPLRVNPEQNDNYPAPAPKTQSNQTRTQGQSSKFRTVSAAPAAGVDIGGVVKLSANTKGTGVFGRPSSIALAGKEKTSGA